MSGWDFAHRSGLGVVSGPVSGYVECWDFDDAEVFTQFVERAQSCGLGDVVKHIRKGYEDQTPREGRRWLVNYPDDVEWEDSTLARRPGKNKRVTTLIELPTFAIVAPSNGAVHPSGKPYVQLTGGFDSITSYTAEEREALLELARSFDEMRRKQHVPATSKPAPVTGRPGDDYNARTEWSELLEAHAWSCVLERDGVSYWRRPDKSIGVSATTNFGGSDLFFPFTSSTEFEPEKSYTKFGAYALLEHGGDFGKAALVLSKQGFGEQETPTPAPRPIAPCSLSETLTTFRRWLYLNDPAPVYVVAATLVANKAPGDPVWTLLVCAPSTGKTEILSAATRLPYVISAAKVTEASLLSGTSKRERVTGATGGLLRQVGDFGVLLLKDFSSVLAQNKDARAEAMAALREVYDGKWDRPVGTDGGRVLSWRGKCGLIGAATPALDQYGQVLSALGDRFVLLRMPDADVDAFGLAALNHGDREAVMRDELADALAGLVEHADLARVNRPLSESEQHRLIRLAAYTARTRTAVVRDGYRQDVLYLPQVEGPGRLVKAYARLLGGLEAIGCDSATSWDTLARISCDCAPALRTLLIRELLARPAPARTSDLASCVEVVTKTAARHLEDLSILKLADRTKRGSADNSPDYWAATTWLRDHWPESETDNYPPAHKTPSKGEAAQGANSEPSTPLDTSQSHSADDVLADPVIEDVRRVFPDAQIEVV